MIAFAAIALWSTVALLGLKLKHVPPFLLVGVALLIGGSVGLRRGTFRGLRPRTVLLGVYGLFAYHFCLFTALRLAPPVEASLLNYLGAGPAGRLLLPLGPGGQGRRPARHRDAGLPDAALVDAVAHPVWGRTPHAGVRRRRRPDRGWGGRRQ